MRCCSCERRKADRVATADLDAAAPETTRPLVLREERAARPPISTAQRGTLSQTPRAPPLPRRARPEQIRAHRGSRPLYASFSRCSPPLARLMSCRAACDVAAAASSTAACDTSVARRRRAQGRRVGVACGAGSCRSFGIVATCACAHAEECSVHARAFLSDACVLHVCDPTPPPPKPRCSHHSRTHTRTRVRWRGGSAGFL